MLSIRNVTIETRHPILTNFSYDFEPGKLYGLVATNGSGKTTFFRSLMGLLPVRSGQVSWQGGASRQDFFYYESSEWFDGNLSGLDYLRFVKEDWQSAVSLEEVIALWDMSDYIKVPIKKYSLGMKQRVLIAMYQVSDAKCLIMDEITNGLDEASRQIFFEVLNQMRNQGKLIMLSSHYQEDIAANCDFILHLKNQTMEVERL